MISREIKKETYLFHPYEISFCGYSGSGKTSLITKLIENLSKKYKVAYLKSSCKFQMDQEGKDTFQAKQAGANPVYISSDSGNALLNSEAINPILQKLQFLESDFAILEGWKKSKVPKLVLLAEHVKRKSDVDLTKLENTLAYIVEKESLIPDGDTPYFFRDDVEGISTFIEEYFVSKIQSTPLHGLVLSGGKSTRMGKDKGMLDYRGSTQIEQCVELLTPYCEKVFLSSREGQYNPEFISKFSNIYDQYLDFGPIGGILSAMKSAPNASWLVVACDLPYLNPDTIQQLLEQRNPFKVATYFNSEFDGFPEPLCSIYEPKSFAYLTMGLAVGYKCPRKVLINSPCKSLDLSDKKALENINSLGEYESFSFREK